MAARTHAQIGAFILPVKSRRDADLTCVWRRDLLLPLGEVGAM